MSETNLPKRNYFVFVPIILFLALAAIFASQLLSGKDSSVLPSVLVGKSSPVTNLPPLNQQVPGISSANFKGRVTVLNVFASWCVPCREEHPYLLALTKDARFTLAGFNYKDTTVNASDFILEFGNPYDEIGTDLSGRAGIEWGVYGVPETYVIDKNGVIIHKHVGPLDAQLVSQELMPVIEKALAGS